MVPLAYGGQDGDCDKHDQRMDSGQELDKVNEDGVEVKGLAESRKYRLADALATFISLDHARALRWHTVVLPSIDTEETLRAYVEHVRGHMITGSKSVNPRRRVDKDA